MQALAVGGGAALLAFSWWRESDFKKLKADAAKIDERLNAYGADAKVIEELLKPTLQNMENIKLHVEQINLIRSIDMATAIERISGAAKTVLDREKTLKSIPKSTNSDSKIPPLLIVASTLTLLDIAVACRLNGKLMQLEAAALEHPVFGQEAQPVEPAENPEAVEFLEEVVQEPLIEEVQEPGLGGPAEPIVQIEMVPMDDGQDFAPDSASESTEASETAEVELEGITAEEAALLRAKIFSTTAIVVLEALEFFAIWHMAKSKEEEQQEVKKNLEAKLKDTIAAINSFGSHCQSFFGEIEHYHKNMRIFIKAVKTEAHLIQRTYGATEAQKKILKDLENQISYPEFTQDMKSKLLEIHIEIKKVVDEKNEGEHLKKLNDLRTRVEQNTKLKDELAKLFQGISNAIEKTLKLAEKVNQFLGDVSAKLTTIQHIVKSVDANESWDFLALILKKHVPEYQTKTEKEIGEVITGIIAYYTDKTEYTQNGQKIDLADWRKKNSISEKDGFKQFEYIRQVDAIANVRVMQEKKSQVWEYIYQFVANSGPNSDSKYNYAFLYARTKGWKKEKGLEVVTARRLNTFAIRALKDITDLDLSGWNRGFDWVIARSKVKALFPNNTDLSDEIVYAAIALFTLHRTLVPKQDSWPSMTELRDRYKKTDTQKYADMWSRQASNYEPIIRDMRHPSVFADVYQFVSKIENDSAIYFLDKSTAAAPKTTYVALDNDSIAKIQQIHEAIGTNPAKSYADIIKILGSVQPPPSNDVINNFAAVFTDEETYQGKNLVEIRSNITQEYHTIIDSWLIQAKLKNASERDKNVFNLKRKLLTQKPTVGSAMMTFEKDNTKTILMAFGKGADIYLGVSHDNRVWKYHNIIPNAEPYAIFGMCRFNKKVVIVYSSKKTKNENGYQVTYAYSGTPEDIKSWTERIVPHHNGDIGIGVTTWTVDKPRAPSLATRLVIAYINKNGGICTAISFNDPTEVASDIFNTFTPFDMSGNSLKASKGIGFIQYGKKIYMAFIKEDHFHIAVSSNPFPLDIYQSKWKVNKVVSCVAGIGLVVKNFQVQVGIIDSNNRVALALASAGGLAWKVLTTNWRAQSGYGLTTYGDVLVGAFVDSQNNLYAIKQDFHH